MYIFFKYQICFLTFLKERQYKMTAEMISDIHDSSSYPPFSEFVALADKHKAEVKIFC